MDRVDEIIERLAAIEKRMMAMESLHGGMIKAFPLGDIEGHRRYHELRMEELEERRRLRIAIQEKTVSALLWSVLVFMAASAWKYVADLLTGAR